MNYDNPAARLLNILESGRKIGANENCRTVWQRLLEVDDNNPMLMSRLGKVMELPELIIVAIKEQYPSPRNTWSHWEAQVNLGFMSQNLNGKWETFIQHIDSHSLTYLHLASDLLQAKSNTKLMPNEELISLRDKLQEIYNEVMGSEVNDEVKRYLARNLRKLINSIDEYKLTGALPLLDSIETTIGHIHIDTQYRNFLKDTELGQKLLETLGAMANVVTVAVGIPQLSQAIALIAG